MFEIFIDRLKGGATQKIEESLAPSFLGPDEPELKFQHPVKVSGSAYLTDDHLVVTFNAETKVGMPCAICNKMVETELKISHFTMAEPIVEIPGAVFDFREPLREAL